MPKRQQSESALLPGSLIVGSLMASYVLDTWWIVVVTIIAIPVGRYTAIRMLDKFR